MAIFNRLLDLLTTPYSLYLVMTSKEMSPGARWRAGIFLLAVSFYVINPFDIIPDFVIVAGWLDDLVIIPAGMALARAFIPELKLWEKARTDVGRTVRRLLVWIMLGILLWLAVTALSVFLVWRYLI